MSALTPAATAVLRAEARLFAREPGAVFWVLAFPTLLLAGLGLIPDFREAAPELGGRRVIDLYVPTSVLVALVTGGLQVLPATLTGYRERGILRRMRTTPAHPADLLFAQVVLFAAVALLSAVTVLAVGRVALDVALPRQPLAYLLALVLAVLAAVAMGLVISAVSRTVKMASALGLVAFFPSLFAAGVYVPVQVLPGALRTVLELTPFGAATAALDQAATGGWPAWWHLAVMAGWTVALAVAAVRWFRWE